MVDFSTYLLYYWTLLPEPHSFQAIWLFEAGKDPLLAWLDTHLYFLLLTCSVVTGLIMLVSYSSLLGLVVSSHGMGLSGRKKRKSSSHIAVAPVHLLHLSCCLLREGCGVFGRCCCMCRKHRRGSFLDRCPQMFDAPLRSINLTGMFLARHATPIVWTR